MVASIFAKIAAFSSAETETETVKVVVPVFVAVNLKLFAELVLLMTDVRNFASKVLVVLVIE
ncbi:hypothetical protein DLJ58_09425 [Micromonospora arida]|uniref:Uncharacterized protein n=1 Tax=Micromonospora arida TaxID=2203715 RepID=A0A3N9XDG9_9ACTN|nr:hypothetical protein DLJ58_09425 [Micromonospora arida]